METCRRCGHALGIGRFCTNCGHPVGAPADAPVDDTVERPAATSPDPDADWRTDTAERPRLAVPPPEPASRPLFADEVASPRAEPRPAPPPPADPSRSHAATDHRRRPAPWVPWLTGVVALALVAGLGAWLLLAGRDDPDTAEEAPGSPPAPARSEPAEDPEASPPPDRDADRTRNRDRTREQPRDLADAAAVTAPRAARPSRDTDGSSVSYVAANLVDGDLTTCWRMPGDGTGESLTFRFQSPVRLRSVGLVNGYAKTGSDSRGTLDWYAGNRRVREVEWTFDDGTVVRQDLRESRSMQTTRVGGVETQSVTVRLVEVSPPGPGRASRNYTAVSEVALRGTTG